MKTDNSNTTNKKKFQISIPKFLFFWKDNHHKTMLRTTNILINGKLLTCILLSVVSGLIDIIFFSGLSKSFYELFGLIFIPAGLLMSIMSIGFTMGKFFCAMQLGAIAELKNRLKNFGYKWYKNLNKLSWKWHVIHKFLIGVSILTAISLSVVSIGTGVTRNSTLLKQIDDLIVEGTRYSEILNTTRDTSLTVSVARTVDTSEQDAIIFTQTHMSRIRPVVEQYKVDRESFTRAGFDVTSTNQIDWNGQIVDNPSLYWDQRNESINNLLQNAGYGTVSGRNIYNLNLSQVERTIRQNYLNTYRSRDPEEIKREMEEARQSTIEEADGWLKTLNALNFTRNERIRNEETGKIEYRTTPIIFDDKENTQNTETKVLITRALSMLRQYRTDVESDSGDIGSSSKMFMMIGNAWDKLHTKKAATVSEALNTNVKTGMGSTEIMIMIIIMLFGIVQEFLIALFTPKSTISRKMIYTFDAYFESDFDINRFMLSLYLDYYNKGIITKEDFEAKARKCVDLMQNTLDSLIEKYTKKLTTKKEPKVRLVEKQLNNISNVLDTIKAEPVKQDNLETSNVTSYSSKVTDAINEIENLLNN